MARQEEMFAETIINMKRALRRRDEDSESDDSIKKPSNRGNKLKRKARFVQEGRLDTANGTKAYRRRINYNGYFRDIISTNSFRMDPDGDIIDDMGEESDNDLEDATIDPYREVRLQDVLKPLTSAAALRDHPSMSVPYTSKALDEMIQGAQDMIYREHNALSKMKRLFDEFRGDTSWMPVSMFETENDLATLTQDLNPPYSSSIAGLDLGESGSASTNGDQVSVAKPGTLADDTTESKGDGKSGVAESAKSVGSSGLNTEDTDSMDHTNGILETPPSQNHHISAGNQNAAVSAVEAGSNDSSVEGIQTRDHALVDASVRQAQDLGGGADADETLDMEDEDAQPAHRMTTRAKAQAASSNTDSRDDSPDSIEGIHPMFLAPEYCMPSSNKGLPNHEADDTRRVLSAYIQKQEDVVNSSWKLYNGLLKAKRLRDNVMEWCTAEGHVGEMSDGEDWCDLDQWGLNEGELQKGKEEDEEELRTEGQKKTRNRRAAAGGAA